MDEISIGIVAVKKKHRGKGISREMMLKAIEFIEILHFCFLIIDIV